jgi:hypothetical protein
MAFGSGTINSIGSAVSEPAVHDVLRCFEGN